MDPWLPLIAAPNGHLRYRPQTSIGSVNTPNHCGRRCNRVDTSVPEQVAARNQPQVYEEADVTDRSDQGVAAYHYEPIDTTDIRIIQLEKSDHYECPLQLKLEHISLLHARSRGYTTLSYAWGADAASQSVLLNGKGFRIRPNLDKILRTWRSIQGGLIWVDAICINQDDLNERNVQVMRMRGIYALASSTVVAINTSDTTVMHLLPALGLAQPGHTMDRQCPHLQKLIKDEHVQSALIDFCTKDYWKRIWIVQEFAIGPKINLLLGGTMVDARNLETVIQLLDHQSKAPSQWCAQAHAIFGIRKLWQQRQPIPLLKMLCETKHSRCQRRHDRVYGLLGLVPDTLDFMSEPSYQTGVTELSMSMTRSYIERHSLDIILLAQPDASNKLPSWCPDLFHFDRHPPAERIAQQAFRHYSSPHGTRWHATGMSSASCSFRGRCLVSLARRIGVIQSLGRAWSDGNNSSFPCHSQRWAMSQRRADVRAAMMRAMLRDQFRYNGFPRQQDGCVTAREFLEAYTYVTAFLPSTESNEPDSSSQCEATLERWIHGNRQFFAGGTLLKEHARRLWPAVWATGLSILDCDFDGVYATLQHMAKQDLRMMCLDDDEYGIGWAAKGALLFDEVFLVPGCSVPVILRHEQAHGRYRFVGDAVVVGAMNNEVWGNTGSGDLVRVEIV